MADLQVQRCEARYSSFNAGTYIFNLIVGTGALTLPLAFREAGWIIGTVVLAVLAIVSYATTTFIVEALSISNVLYLSQNGRLSRQRHYSADSSSSSPDSEFVNLIESADGHDDDLGVGGGSYVVGQRLIRERRQSESGYNATDGTLDFVVEVGAMAKSFLSPLGRVLFYVSLLVYLYGDLAIYSVAVAKTLRDAACETHNEAPLCRSSYPWLTKFGAYRIMLLTFVGCTSPFVLMNMTKTKYIQATTTVLRWLAFIAMIWLAISNIISAPPASRARPPAVRWSGTPNMFGVAVYSFMCHHSLPSLVTPVRRASDIMKLIVVDYCMIFLFYLLLAFTAIFAFDHIYDLYTLNFEPDAVHDSTVLYIVHYVVALFPAFTLAWSFPIIGITVKNNLTALLTGCQGFSTSGLCSQFLVAILAICPPVMLAFFTENVEFLVSITGGFAGVAVQYVWPALLVNAARQRLGSGSLPRHLPKSPLVHPAWTHLVNVWALVCVVFVSWNLSLTT